MNIYAYIMMAFCVVGMVGSVYTIGEHRKPKTRGDAAVTIVSNLALIALFATAIAHHWRF